MPPVVLPEAATVDRLIDTLVDEGHAEDAIRVQRYYAYLSGKSGRPEAPMFLATFARRVKRLFGGDEIQNGNAWVLALAREHGSRIDAYRESVVVVIVGDKAIDLMAYGCFQESYTLPAVPNGLRQAYRTSEDDSAKVGDRIWKAVGPDPMREMQRLEKERGKYFDEVEKRNKNAKIVEPPTLDGLIDQRKPRRKKPQITDIGAIEATIVQRDVEYIK